MNESFFQTSLLDLLFVLFKRKWSILIIFTTAVLLSFVWLWFIRDPRYEVTAKVLVKIGYEQVNSPTVFGDKMAIYNRSSNDVNTEVDILKNTELVAAVVDYLKLDQERPRPVPTGFIPRLRYDLKKIIRTVKDTFDEILIRVGMRERLTAREKAISTLDKELSVTAVRDSNVIVASATLPFREGSSVVLNTLLDFYRDFRLKAFQAPTLVGFLSDEGKSSKASLTGAEEELKRFESQSDIVSLDSQKDVLIRRIADAKAALSEAEILYKEALSKVENLEKESKSAEPDFANVGSFERGSFLENLVQDLSTLQKEREKLRMTELDSSVKIQNNRSQFNMLLSLLSSNLHSVLIEKQAQYNTRKEQIEKLQNTVDALHDKESKWRELKRNTQTLESEYLINLKRLKEGMASAALEKNKIGNVAIIQRAMDPAMPKGMRKATLLAIIVVISLFLSLAWVSIAEFFDDRIYTPGDLERHLAAPVISVVPAVKKKELNI